VYNPADNEWVNVQEAARILGVSKQAVRQRIYRGTIPHTKDDNGTVYVQVIPPNAGAHGESNDVDNAVLLDYVETLKDRIQHLEEESSRKDHIIMSLTQRIPELEAPPETQRSPETASKGAGRGDVPPEEHHPVERPSWWRKFFGFE
jgi:hypothetical protein